MRLDEASTRCGNVAQSGQALGMDESYPAPLPASPNCCAPTFDPLLGTAQHRQTRRDRHACELSKQEYDQEWAVNLLWRNGQGRTHSVAICPRGPIGSRARSWHAVVAVIDTDGRGFPDVQTWHIPMTGLLRC